jgi:hypothetical protein
MKITLTVILIALFTCLGSAQTASVEREFERERPRLSLDRFSIGEDATSGFYYFVYKRRSRIRKIRSVWNGGCCQPPRIEDYYFKDGKPVLYVKLSVEKERLDALLKGRNIALHQDEKLYLRNRRLTTWIENGKTVSTSNPGWKDKERFVLEQVKDLLETYRSYREEKS